MQSKARSIPDWLEKELYPFKSKWFEGDEGCLHYLDEGKGETLLWVHGTPTWSFLYRKQIQALSKHYRCVAVDHLGYGLSDKPQAADLSPMGHARRLEAFIDFLGLRDITLVVHDFGGPIGLSYAVSHPENIKRLVLFNTWMWNSPTDPAKEKLARFFNSSLGKFSYLNLNASIRLLLKMGFADKKNLPASVYRHYAQPFPSRRERQALLSMAQALSNPWYDELWNKAGPLQEKPALLLWGMKDFAFKEEALRRWQTFFARPKTVEFPAAGHFVQEEAAASAVQEIETFMKSPLWSTTREI